VNTMDDMDRYERRRLDFIDLKKRLGFAAYRQMHERTGIDPSYLSRCAYPEGKGGKKRIGDDTVEKLDAAYPGWRERDLDAISNTAKPPTRLKQSENVPIISWVRAGSFCEAHDPFHPGDADTWLPKPSGAGPNTFALIVRGDSMTSPYPGARSYPDGYVIFVDPDQEFMPGTRGIAKIPGTQEVTFKELVSDAGRLYLKPLNPQYDKIEVTEDMIMCGKVIGSYLPE